MSQTGDDAAFEAFVVACYPRLLRVAYLLTGDTARAEDLLQASLLKTWGAWRRTGLGAPEAYVRTVLIRTHVSGRRRRWWGELPFAAVPDTAAPDAFTQVHNLDMLRRSLASLPPRMRAVLVLRYFEDLSEQQTAESLGCSVGTVKSLGSRALARLRELPSMAAEQPTRRTAG